MPSESCGTCRFGAPTEGRLEGSLECRRNPPTGGGRRQMAEWPLTAADAWCGEYEATVSTPKPPRAKRPAVGETETRGES